MGKAIWNVTRSEVRVKWQTAVIMSAGQRSRERNFFQSLGHRSRAGRACISCLEINWFHFLLWALGVGRGEWKGYQGGGGVSLFVHSCSKRGNAGSQHIYLFFPWPPLPLSRDGEAANWRRQRTPPGGSQGSAFAEWWEFGTIQTSYVVI